jgi:hypothetical protein
MEGGLHVEVLSGIALHGELVAARPMPGRHRPDGPGCDGRALAHVGTAGVGPV